MVVRMGLLMVETMAEKMAVMMAVMMAGTRVLQ